MPELGLPPEKIVFVAGIGCCRAFRLLHEHVRDARHPRPRAPARDRARGRPPGPLRLGHHRRRRLALDRRQPPHPRAAAQRPLKILLFNNQIYGLTKGQYSPTSEVGKVTKSTPFGALDHPFNPLALALGAEATFVARTLDVDRAHLTEVLRQAAEHQGTAFVEIYQNCNVFNDGAFDALTDKETKAANQIRLDARRADPLRLRGRARRRAALRREPRDRGRRRGRRGRARRPRRAPPRSRASPSRSPTSPSGRPARRRSASSARSSAPSTARRWRPS